jgi:glycine/sarcosine N-methyltransferase
MHRKVSARETVGSVERVMIITRKNWDTISIMSMYDTFSSDYDRFVSWPGRLAAEMPFLEQHIRAVGGPAAKVLDAATGTGMHAIALAQLGFTAGGADLSAPMIERARANAAQAGVPVDLRVAGFGQLARVFADRAGRYDALLCLGNSLPHLLSLDDLRAALADFAACLRPGGRLIVQNRNFDAVLARRERWMEPQAHREGQREWIFLRFYDYEPDGLINFNVVTLLREQPGQSWQQAVTSTRLYPLRQTELEAALHASGFSQLQAFGALNDQPFSPDTSGNLVMLATRI